MKIQLQRTNADYHFECTNPQGSVIHLDNVRMLDASGFSPMESLLAAVAGCSGIDLLAILKKQRQDITDFSAEIEGERVQYGEATPFKSILVKFHLAGDVDGKKALKAATMSFEKYCSVSKSLNPEINLQYEVYVNGERVEE